MRHIYAHEVKNLGKNDSARELQVVEKIKLFHHYHPYKMINGLLDPLQDDGRTPIDRKLGNLVKEMNRVGLITLGCCEDYDNKGHAFISFKTRKNGKVQYIKWKIR